MKNSVKKGIQFFTVALFIMSFLFSTVVSASGNNSSGFKMDCIDFENHNLGREYFVGDSFQGNGYFCFFDGFRWVDNQWTADGYAMVCNDGYAGGSGQDLCINNINLYVFPNQTIDGLVLYFGEYGGNLNIEINGDFRNFDIMPDLDGQTIGGVKVTVTLKGNGDTGILKLEGDIDSFVIGGQELWVDNICPHTPVSYPDLVVDIISAPKSACIGESLGPITIEIKNIGEVPANPRDGFFHVDLVLSYDTNIGYGEDFLLIGGRHQIFDIIQPGESIQVTFNGPDIIPKDTLPGGFNLGVLVDSKDNHVVESCEYNNDDMSYIQITACSSENNDEDIEYNYKTYILNYNGIQGILKLAECRYYEYRNYEANLVGIYIDEDGNEYKVFGYYYSPEESETIDPYFPHNRLDFYIDFENTASNENDDQKFIGYEFTYPNKGMAGITYMNDVPYGFYLIKESTKINLIDPVKRPISIDDFIGEYEILVGSLKATLVIEGDVDHLAGRTTNIIGKISFEDGTSYTIYGEVRTPYHELDDWFGPDHTIRFHYNGENNSKIYYIGYLFTETTNAMAGFTDDTDDFSSPSSGFYAIKKPYSWPEPEPLGPGTETGSEKLPESEPSPEPEPNTDPQLPQPDQLPNPVKPSNPDNKANFVAATFLPAILLSIAIISMILVLLRLVKVKTL